MTPAEVARRAEALLPGARTAVPAGRATVEVDRSAWTSSATALRDDPGLAASCFDLLTAVDEQQAGLVVVLHLWSLRERASVLLVTRCPADDPRLASLAGVFPGAAWAERELAEMFGLGFDGHPGLTPLRLPDGFEGAPLRKDFVLASRVAQPWPGALEPGQGASARGRRRGRPPGVPRPGTWGPA